MNTQMFQPIRLIGPNPDDWDMVRKRIVAVGKQIEVVFRLSSVPHNLWRIFFFKGWNLWYKAMPPTIDFDSLVITCTPPDLLSKTEMVKAIIEDANFRVAPLIRGELAQQVAERKRAALLHKLETEEAKPIGMRIPDDEGGDVLLNMLYKKRAEDRVKLERDLALAELDATLACMVDADLIEVKSRIKKRA